MCDRPLGEPFDDVKSELVRFRVDKVIEELRHPPRISPGFCSILPSSWEMYCELTFGRDTWAYLNLPSIDTVGDTRNFVSKRLDENIGC